MRPSKLGVLAASAALSLIGAAAPSHVAAAEEAKACYRTHCGKSIPQYEGKCGGTAVQQLTTEKDCEVAGGDWTTATNAKQYVKKQ